ncbi:MULTISPECIES: class I SAM-dependent DNA methyltransferase [Hydrocarboniphaga]|uniref:class I SAM-dependent DNA methyltransferase n=1 Tax=Hydrocarboniphaga TaxID=243627 RepID=UPI00058B2778|nr:MULTISPECIES: DNA methyltransferase [Hydrocarboniphaga]MDZ4080142.1 DNA methyltransferase [Hydrocarboniphaga sp.]
MNAVEIEQAITLLAERPFDPAEFPYAFLEAFGNKATTIKRLRAGASNKSDLGGVLQTSNIHILTCDAGRVTQTLAALKASPATAKAKAKFILATDGADFEAEDLTSGETVACAFKDFPDHFGFFLPLAGISTVRQISENAFDIRATSRLNRLYVELLKDNPEWGTAERRHDMNNLMARLIFCFFAEDTDIFVGKGRFTETVAQMSAKDSSNTHEVITTLFRAMNTKREDRAATKIPRWAEDFPYVNGQLFSGGDEVPRFSKIARSYLLHVGGLDWTKINPDIFGSMIQAVAEDEERGELGMHYTSVPNILKVLNPLFLDDLRSKLEEAGDNPRMLLNLRKRIAKIRVFDPACGSGNFLVIAYKEMRAIEAEINRRRGEPDLASEIPLTNFRGIELRDFPAEIARLALVIAEYQCDVLYRGQKLALAEFLPLRNENWIVSGNSLRLDWLKLCPPTGTGVKVQSDDLFGTPLNQAEIDFANEGGETYICGNPQFKGARKQSKSQKQDMALVFEQGNDFKDCDYVTAWYLKAAEYVKNTDAAFAFVSTSSVCEGEQVAHLWSRLYGYGLHIQFAHQGFKWRNNAANNAVVQCVIIGVGAAKPTRCALYQGETKREVDSISPYLISGAERYVRAEDVPLSRDLHPMVMGSMARDDGNLILTVDEAARLIECQPAAEQLLRGLLGSQELIHVRNRKCLWIEDDHLKFATEIPEVLKRIEAVRAFRSSSSAKTTRGYAAIPHKFAQRAHRDSLAIIVAATSSEEREYIPADLLGPTNIITNAAYAIYGASVWELAIVASRLHMAWIATVCGKLETRLRYSSTLGWHSFPLPTLTEKNKADLTCCAEGILLAREHHFPATIADLYDPESMPADLRAAHERNDEVLERIYIGRRFKNDTERLEKLLDLYTKMTASVAPAKGKRRKAGANA